MIRRILLPIISGTILILAFAPFGRGYLACAGFIPLFFALEGAAPRKAFFTGWLWGFVFFLGTVYWVVHSMYFYGGVGFVAGTLVMLLLVVYLALFPAVFSVFLSRTGTHGTLTRVFLIPSLWVSLEYMRGYLFSGFPWVLLGYSQINYLPLVQIADLAGVWGVSFWVMAINAAVYLVIKKAGQRDFSSVFKAAATAVLLTAAVFGYGLLRIRAVDNAVSTWKPLKVLIAQGNIEQSLKWDEGARLKTVEVYRDLSLSAAAGERPGLVVWPETAMPFYLAYDTAMRETVSGTAREAEAYLLTGAPHYTPGGMTYKLYNSAFLFNRAGGLDGRYDKTHLVPFGEYVPLKRLFFFARKLTEGVGDFVPGPGRYPLRFDGNGIGVLICYEAIFPEISADFLNNGANLLVNITNDAWFGRTSAPYQHFDMSVMRAVENRVFLVRAANTGISAIVDPSGRVVEKTRLFERGVVSGTVGIKNKGKTVFSGYGRFFPLITVVFSAVAVFGFRKRPGRG
ncbi:MAG: apolipoprotein N-acyltransferase [Deltaproteobacteria bacterium]|nr:apolipoprotein N-acyltransferase [Deltaproteobacteria bacterium]